MLIFSSPTAFISAGDRFRCSRKGAMTFCSTVSDEKSAPS